MCASNDTNDTGTSPATSVEDTGLRRRHQNGAHRRVLLCDLEPLHYKSISQEIRGLKDLQRIADSAPVLLNVRATTPETVVNALLAALVSDGLLPESALEEASAALIAHEPHLYIRRDPYTSEDAFDNAPRSSELLPTTTAAVPENPPRSNSQHLGPAHWRRHILGPAFLIPFARIAALNGSDHKYIVAMARLTSSANLGVSNNSTVRFVIAVLGPQKDMKETKTSIEIARTISSLFQDDQFFHAARHCYNQDEFRTAIRKYISRETGTESDADAVAVDPHDDKTFKRTGRFAGGLIADIKRRYKPSTYLSDWTDGLGDVRSLLKYLSTTVWLYFAIIMPTIAFGALDEKNTRLPTSTIGAVGEISAIGVIETLISQAFAGIVFSVFAGQPLTIVMTTAPLTVFIKVLFTWCKSLDIEFLPFYAWTGIWTAVFLLILVVTDACYLMKYCGRFTEEIFATLIAALFVSEYISPLIEVRQTEPVEVFLLCFLLATGTFLIATMLLNFRRSFLLKPIIRDLLSDFGVPIAILAMTGFRQAFDINVQSLGVPSKVGLSRTNGSQNWLVPLFNIKVQYVFLALVSGILLAMLFFIDQNVSSMLVNKIENKLRKGPGYYLDLVVVSVIIIVQSILGLPWTHAALPHSPLHARQLADVEEYEDHGRRYERVVKSRETRWTGFMTHVLVGLSILAKNALKQIPLAVLYGFFLFLGFGTLDGNALWDRILLLFTQSEKYPPNHYVRRVKIQRIHLYTIIQVLLLAFLWFIKSNFYLGDTIFNAGLLFPLIIVLFIPIRLYVLPRIFTPSELQALSVEEEEHVSDSGATV